MISNKLLKLKIIKIIILLTSITLNAQLVKITHPNLISESDIYVDENGKRYSGVYFYQLNSGNYTATKKFVYLR